MNATCSCSDEFNRIDVEVHPPVVAQPIFSIQEAVRAHESKFVFQDAEINVGPDSAVFIALNPGYQTAALFRSMRVMIPHYARIAELSLSLSLSLRAEKGASEMLTPHAGSAFI